MNTISRSLHRNLLLSNNWKPCLMAAFGPCASSIFKCCQEPFGFLVCRGYALDGDVFVCEVVIISVNALRPRQNGRHFTDDVFNCIFLSENVWIPIKFSLKFVPKGPINNIPALVQIMAWRRPGDKPLSEPMMVSLPTPICVTRPQWGLSV